MPMNTTLRGHFESELQRSADARRQGDLQAAWRALERAHVLSQAHAGPHVRAHWQMFLLALRTRALRELFGQVTRILVAAPGSWLGRAPLGNTGRANVGLFQPMPIPADLAAMLGENGPT